MDNDYELLYLAKEDEQIKEFIYQKYSKEILKKVKKYSNKNNIEDYLNEAKFTLYKTIDSYKEEIPYIVYLHKCLNNSMINLLKKDTTKANKIYEKNINYSDDIEVITKFLATEKNNPEKILYNEYSYNSLKNKILSTLTSEEELVFTLKEQNYQIKEISKIIDKKEKTIYNMIGNIKRKIIKIMSNEKK